MRKLISDESGQAVVEYVLMLATALSIVAIFKKGFDGIRDKLWVSFTKDISAACPGCPPDPNIK